MAVLEGKVWRYGDNIDTDVIIPARYLNTFDPKELAKHCMVDIDPTFSENVKVGDTVAVQTTYGEFTYTVREIKILEKDSFGEITKDNGVEQLTLYTCYPFVYIGNAPDRYAIFCDLEEAVLNS